MVLVFWVLHSMLELEAWRGSVARGIPMRWTGSEAIRSCVLTCHGLRLVTFTGILTAHISWLELLTSCRQSHVASLACGPNFQRMRKYGATLSSLPPPPLLRLPLASQLFVFHLRGWGRLPLTDKERSPAPLRKPRSQQFCRRVRNAGACHSMSANESHLVVLLSSVGAKVGEKEKRWLQARRKSEAMAAQILALRGVEKCVDLEITSFTACYRNGVPLSANSDRAQLLDVWSLDGQGKDQEEEEPLGPRASPVASRSLQGDIKDNTPPMPTGWHPSQAAIAPRSLWGIAHLRRRRNG